MKKHFQTSKKWSQSSNILIFAVFVTYYDRCNQSINWSSIVILSKINLEKVLKLNFLDRCFKKVVFLRFTEFHGLHDDLKIIWKKLTAGRYPVQKRAKLKKRRQHFYLFLVMELFLLSRFIFVFSSSNICDWCSVSRFFTKGAKTGPCDVRRTFRHSWPQCGPAQL